MEDLVLLVEGDTSSTCAFGSYYCSRSSPGNTLMWRRARLGRAIWRDKGHDLCSFKCKITLAAALRFLLDTWMLLDFLSTLDFGGSKGSFDAPLQCQSSAGGTQHNLEVHPLAFLRALHHRMPISPLIVASDVFSQ